MTTALSKLPFNISASEPELKDVLDLFKRDIFLSLNCHQVGVVQAFDRVKQTVTAQIPYKKTFYERNPVDGTYAPVLVDYPLLVDCPVVALGGGGFSLTLPITPGDECLVFFNDRDLDNWLQGQTGQGVATARAHNFADGMILVGLRSNPNVVTNWSGTGAELRNKAGTVKVAVNPADVTVTSGTVSLKLDLATSKVTLTNGVTSLGAVLSSLVSALNTMAAAEVSAAGSAPLTPLVAGFSALGTALTTIATQLSGLLA